MPPVRDKPWLVYFASGNYWTGAVTGRHHILKRLASSYNILFVNSIGMANIRKIRRNTILGRVRNKLRAYMRYLRKADGWYIFSPISLPLGLGALDAAGAGMAAWQLRMVFRWLGIRRPVLWVCHPRAAELIDGIDHAALVYNYSDKFVSFREIDDRESVQRLDEQLVHRSTHIICNLLHTYEELHATGHGYKAFYIPHSVDFDRFNALVDSVVDPPADMAGIPGPIIGYYGTLTDSNDWEIIRYCATARPQWSFVFIGTVREDMDPGIRALPNVHFPGRKPYEELPRYLKFFDLCIMFWRVTDWIYNSSPLKTKEFLAMGKAIVSVRIYELMAHYSDIMSFATGPEEFLERMDHELAEDSEERRRLRIARVAGESWERTAGMVEAILATTPTPDNPPSRQDPPPVTD